MKMKRSSITHRTQHVIQFCALIIITTLACLNATAQTLRSQTSVLAGEKPKAKKVAEKSDAQPATQIPATQAPKQLKIGNVNFNGSLRLRVENYGWFETPGHEDKYTFGAAVLRLSLGQQKEKYDWQVEGEFPVLINLPEKAIAPAPQGQLGIGANYFAANGKQDASAILKQAYVRAKNLFGDKANSLRIGRFEFVDGMETNPSDATLVTLKREQIAHRLLGNFGFSHVGRSFDAVQFVHNTKSGNFTFVMGRPTEGVFQLRGMKELDVDIWYGAYTKPVTSKKMASEFRLLALHYHDGRGALKTDNRTLALRNADRENIRLTTIGGNYVGALKTSRGTVDLLVWGVGQFGSWGNQDHRAGALAFEGGFQPAGELAKVKTWIRGGYSYTTGDDNAADGRHTTFFQVLPTPRWYARFPFYNMMNNEDVYTQVRLKPHARLAFRGEVHSLLLSNKNDLWYAGGGAFQEGSFGYTGRAVSGHRSLGTLFDLSADITVTPTTTLTFYGAGVRGGDVESAIYPAGGANPTARFFYAEMTKRF
jgi:Alginate export